MLIIATSRCAVRVTNPARQRTVDSPSTGRRTAVNFAKATATAAIVPVWMTRKSVQPYKNPTRGFHASRRYTYCPPARGIIAASSP